MEDNGSFTLASQGGASLHGYVWPAPNPRAVMSLVHGFGEHAGRYADMASALNASGISVVAVDLRGHGRSNGKRGVTRKGMADYQADLNALLDKTRSLFPYLPHVLYGHSMGGGIVLKYGFNPAPDISAFIASAPLIETPKPTPSGLIKVMKFISKIMPGASLAQPINGAKVSTLLAEQKIYEEDPLNHGRMGFGTGAGILGTGKWIAQNAASWNRPLLIMHALQDELTSFAASETFAEAAAQTEFVAYDRVAHEMHNDVTRDRVYALMCDYILKHTQISNQASSGAST